MSRIGRIAIGAALLGLLLALWVSRAPVPEPQAAPPPAPAPAALTAPAALPPPAESAPLPPALESAPAAPAPRLRAAPAAEPRASAAPVESAAPAAESADPEAATVPLDKLLSWEEARPASRGVDLGRPAQPDAQTAAEGPGVRDRVYLERRTDEMSPSDRERKLETTDVGVRVPVAGSVEVRGGVRIESRQDGEAEADESTPTVGVGVRF